MVENESSAVVPRSAELAIEMQISLGIKLCLSCAFTALCSFSCRIHHFGHELPFLHYELRQHGHFKVGAQHNLAVPRAGHCVGVPGKAQELCPTDFLVADLGALIRPSNLLIALRGHPVTQWDQPWVESSIAPRKRPYVICALDSKDLFGGRGVSSFWRKKWLKVNLQMGIWCPVQSWCRV